jgi:hypothetical protein
MAEKEAEVVEQTEEQAAASFAAGFDSETPQPQAAPTPTDAATAEAQPAQQQEPSAEQPPEPKYVQLTEEQLAQIMATVDQTANLKKGLDSVAGTVGNVRKALDQVRSQTPAGASVEITDDDFAELKADFPELAGHTRAALERIVKRMNLTGTGEPATSTFDPEAVRKTASEIVHAQGLDDLNDLHPGWQDIVGKPDDDNDYRKWLATQPEKYQELIRSTYSATITSRSIDRFKAAQAAAQAKPAAARPQTPASPDAARRDRLREAVQPRGQGTPPAPSQPTPQDNFNAGFNGG